ncbi:carbohydrate ABC transporter permease [Microcella alkaliphila]|jgi:raffinose/stachyose/melibiose transport system permease protein|uniref:Carbohydrate ABC transporter membrane protein n=1 Tax=Microcella alkaliphila TaxID=279828 RepID=A0A0U5BI81_9MICO|nr:sugar ABC transporter permease [Microcella alkaliphila]BAU31253.1 carbohydrate ABC transporter membrane protein [Microcella alkaliphila]
MSLTTTSTGSAATAAGPVPPSPAPPRAPRSRQKSRGLLLIWVFVAPALIVYVTFVLVPVALAAVYSFFNWNGLGALDRFIGFDNYVRALSDPIFIGAMTNNFLIVVLSLLIQGPLAIGIALLLNRPLRGRALIRTLVFVPYVLSEVVAGLAFRLMLPPGGPLDSLLTSVGWTGEKPLWLADPDVAFWTLFAVITWKYLGFAIILMLAGLQGVPEELSEAAAIDGASWWQTQRHITLPLLGPTIRIWAFLSMIGSLQLFDMVWILTGGGPLNATETMATYMVEYGNGRSQIGYGSAVAVILFVVSLVIALLYQRYVLRRDMRGAITRG